MTQDEVDLIYDYLHENYRYKDGELIRIKGANGHNAGEKLGTFSFNDKWKSPSIKSILVINKKRYGSTLAHFIFIFHYKRKPTFIEYIDNNETNLRIENLKEISVTKQYIKNTKNCKGIQKIENGAGIFWRPIIQVNKQSVFLGHHLVKDNAIKAYKIAKEAVSKEILNPNDIKKYVMQKLGYDNIPINKNRSGFKCIKKTKQNTYYGYTTKKGHKIITHTFKTPEAAHEALLIAKKEYESP